jgi:hypothetical protein
MLTVIVSGRVMMMSRKRGRKCCDLGSGVAAAD